MKFGAKVFKTVANNTNFEKYIYHNNVSNDKFWAKIINSTIDYIKKHEYIQKIII